MTHVLENSALQLKPRNAVKLTAEALGHGTGWWVSRGRCQNGVKRVTFQSGHLVWSEVSRAEPHHTLTQRGAHFRHSYIHTGRNMQLISYMIQVKVREKVVGSPSASSAPKTSTRDADIPTQCRSESRRRLKLMSAASTPNLARPSQSATWSGRLSMNSATTSPEVQPWLSAQWATALEIWSNWEKVHVSPVASYTSAGLSGCRATVCAKMEGMVFPFRIWCHSASLTLNST